jgi:hypothetical protein
LDVTASYGLAGIGGTAVRSPPGRCARCPALADHPGRLLRYAGTLFNQKAPTWNFAANFSYPIGSSSADANLARARVQQRQTIAQARALELTIATEVTNAALLVESNRERLQAAQVAREFAEKRLEAEQSRFEVGLSTNFFVVQAQRDLRDSRTPSCAPCSTIGEHRSTSNACRRSRPPAPVSVSRRFSLAAVRRPAPTRAALAATSLAVVAINRPV